MGDWFIGEIRAFAMPWAPQSWMLCDGASLTIQQYAALYAVLGVAFGGNAQTTFNLPDLRGRVPLGAGQSSLDGVYYLRGAAGGVEGVTLTSAQAPTHSHNIQALDDLGGVPNPTNNFFASANKNTTVPVAPNLYGQPISQQSMIALNPATISSGAAAAAHGNVQPSLVVNYCIAYSGLFPPRN